MFIENRFSKNSWEAEALSELLDIYKYYSNEISLGEIISMLRMHLPSDI